MTQDPPPITSRLADFAVGSEFGALPGVVTSEGIRAFVNWMGCVLGGCRDPAVAIAAAVAQECGGARQSTLIGRAAKADVASAAFVNCLSSAVNAFDDTHLATVTHPTGPVASALLAYAERRPVRGTEFITALAAGIELECRMSNVVVAPPSHASMGIYITGLTGPIGAAAALGRLMRLDREHMAWAIGLAATKGAGIRATHGSMAGAVVPADAARSGVLAAQMAQGGFTCSPDLLEARRGFIEVHAPGADPSAAVDRLGDHFEMLANSYKPYPCGIVIHPAIDACLDLAGRLPRNARLESLSLRVHPLALALADRRMPASVFEAQVSLFHWCAVALLRRTAGLAELSPACIDDSDIAGWRQRILATADPSLGRDEAFAEARLRDGTVLVSHASHARGSIARPLSDTELDDKFLKQAREVLPADAATELLGRCRSITSAGDVGHYLMEVLRDR
jgi:2-methylcitrate dehydratase PrpD